MRRRSGSALVLAILAVTLIVSMVLSASVAVRLRIVRAAARAEREDARAAAFSAIAESLASLAGDTNACDSLDEAWASDKLPVALVDEESKMNVLSATTNQIAALVEAVGGVDSGEEARQIAEGVIVWRETGGLKPAATEQLADAPEMTPEIFVALLPYCTVHGGGKANVNTVSPEVLRAMVLPLADDEQAAKRIVENFMRAREQGIVIDDLRGDKMAQALFGNDRVVGAAETKMLQELGPFFGVTSDYFSGEARETDSGGRILCDIEFTWSRADGAYVRWTER